MDLSLALSTILSPVPLFFALGLLAALARSDMSIPEAFAKGLAIYLMMAIGLKGGVEMSKGGFTGETVALFAAGIALSAALPLIAFALLRATSPLNRIDAAAVAAHYGSISIVTFVAATEAVRLAGLTSSGTMIAVAAIMEAPAILTALWLAGRERGEPEVAGSEPGELFREVALNASIVVLVGALVIGFIVGEPGMARIDGFFVTPFQGILCLFILDLGLAAGRGLRQGWRMLTTPTLAFGLYMPLISAAAATATSALLALSVGDTALLITLAASASYIAVPAAMRLALPKARPSVYLTLSLGITFPFNLTVGIPLYVLIASAIGS